MALYFEDTYNTVFLSNGVAFRKAITVAGNTVVTAGGALAVAIGSTAAPNIYSGSGAPTVSAPKGSLYLRTDGSGTTDRAYINTNGTTTWTALTTAA